MDQMTMKEENDGQPKGRSKECSSLPAQPAKVGNDCQLQSLFEDTVPITLSDQLRRSVLRLLSAAERRVDRYRQKLSPRPFRDSPAIGSANEGITLDTGGTIQPGQWVEVLTYDEIQATLNDKNMCDGLEFMEGMRRYCGRRLRVKNLVRMMFDERKWRMLKAKHPRYILDEAICDGSGMYDKEGCDRSCFYFWTDCWFRRG